MRDSYLLPDFCWCVCVEHALPCRELPHARVLCYHHAQLFLPYCRSPRVGYSGRFAVLRLRFCLLLPRYQAFLHTLPYRSRVLTRLRAAAFDRFTTRFWAFLLTHLTGLVLLPAGLLFYMCAKLLFSLYCPACCFLPHLKRFGCFGLPWVTQFFSHLVLSSLLCRVPAQILTRLLRATTFLLRSRLPCACCFPIPPGYCQVPAAFAFAASAASGTLPCPSRAAVLQY